MIELSYTPAFIAEPNKSRCLLLNFCIKNRTGYLQRMPVYKIKGILYIFLNGLLV